MNLKINVPAIKKATPAVIEWNFEEMKSELKSALDHFQNQAVSVDNVQDAKKMCSDLNKAEKSLSKFRIATKKELTNPITKFEDEVKELAQMIKDTHDPIKTQIDKFVVEWKQQRAEDIELVINQTREEIELNNKYFELVERKEEYLNQSMSINKIKKDIVDQFKELHMKQQMEQMKIDTVNAVIEAHNSKLKFKFTFEYFQNYITEDISVAELNAIVNKKVTYRLEEEKAELERIEREKQEAIEKARQEAERKAKEEAERKERELKERQEAEERKRREEQERKEREHQAELDRIKRENERKLKEAEIKAQQEALKTIETVTESVDKYIPIEAEKGDRHYTRKLQLKGTKKQFDALKEYLDASGMQFETIK